MRDILFLNIQTTGFCFRLFGYGICIIYLKKSSSYFDSYFDKSNSDVNFLKIGKFYIYLLTNKN